MSPLDGSRPDNGHLHDEAVKRPRFHAWQHRHLGAAFDLEGAEGIGLADHRVGGRILLLDIRQAHGDILMIPQQLERLRHAGQHAEREHVDLHELQRLDVVLVPFHDLAVLHGRRFDRHQIVKPVLRQNETARMLSKMAGRAH